MYVLFDEKQLAFCEHEKKDPSLGLSVSISSYYPIVCFILGSAQRQRLVVATIFMLC